jgi:Tfp pilus assembly protein PilO
MKRSQKVFLFLTVIFILVIGYLSFDISRKTTFPGSKSQLKERLKKQFLKKDSLKRDSATIQAPKP